MLFNTLAFAIFLVSAFVVYWIMPRRSAAQNLVLVLLSGFFYAYWDWRFLVLMLGSVLWTYLFGRMKWNVCLGVAGPLFVLVVFKYFNFFVGSIAVIFPESAKLHLDVVLPLGISFYTFMAIGYLLDVHWGRYEPERNLLTFSSFLMFFPQIAAGPIGRGSLMLPQFRSERQLDFGQASHGLCLIAYGLFKKMVVADLLSLYLTLVWREPSFYGSITCLIGMLFYSIQIYCDFSGYSDCAIGVAKLFGIDLMQNFNRPYLSATFSDFWRNWHISLSTWFRDYVYIPLGGSRRVLPRVILNTWIVFLLSGLWHGAAWTFVFWGGLHALYLTGGILKKRYLPHPEQSPFLRLWMQRVLVFLGVSFAWIFFRAGTWERAMGYIRTLFSGNIKTSIPILCAGQGPLTFLFCLVACLMLGLSYVLPRDCRFEHASHRFAFCAVCIVIIVFMGLPPGGEFIYFQF